MAHNIAANEKKIDDLFAEESLEHFIAVSRYAFQLDAYSRAFPAQQILLLDFEELKTEPLEIARRVCRHISINDSFPFRQIPPQNIRRSVNGAADFRLTTKQRERLMERLQNDMDCFESAYGFDVLKWGF